MAAKLSADTSEEEFWRAFASEDTTLTGKRVYDPFVGGGSTLVEAARLGARVSGGDVDGMAVRIVRRELNPADSAAVRRAGEEMLAALRHEFEHLYPIILGAAPLHYFSIAEVHCPSCEKAGLLYRDLILARDRAKSGAVVRDHALTAFCPDCMELHELDSAERLWLHCCGRKHRLDEATFAGQHYRCSSCGATATHRELRTGAAPRQIVAVEECPPRKRRALRSVSKDDLRAIENAADEWARRRLSLPHPSGALHAVRSDDRPRSYGIERYENLFTPRQLLVLSRALQWVHEHNLEPDIHDSLELAISNALVTNNRLCGYATDYGRLSALFSVRGYSLPALTVELNPLHPRAGRGTLPACIERVARAETHIVRRYVWSFEKRQPKAREFRFAPSRLEAVVEHRNAADPVADSERGVVDIAVFDPPYFDYIPYEELSEFHRAWLPDTDLAGESLLPNGDKRSETFGLRLGECLSAILTRLRPGRPLTFTYHAAHWDAWRAVGIALDEAKLALTALWPVRSDGHMGHHSHPGNCEWDIILVCRPLTTVTLARLTVAVEQWVQALAPLAVNAADRDNFRFAFDMAAERFGIPNRGIG